MFKPFPPQRSSKVTHSIIAAAIFIFLIGIVVYTHFTYTSSRFENAIAHETETTTDDLSDPDEDLPVPLPVTTTPEEVAVQPRDTSALGGYNVLIADRGNNRLIEVSPDKKIIWEYDFNLPKPGLGADDSFFANAGKDVIVNLEMYHVIELIDYQTKQVVWSYGTPGVPGHTPGFLNTPDDAYMLPNGDIIVADIKNCRVIEINQNKQIVHQYGQTKLCSKKSGFLDEPNGDTPQPNGHILISTIRDHNLLELNQDWQPIFSMPLPVAYPSDPQSTQDGNILISDYRDPGQIVKVSRQGNVLWRFTGDSSSTLNRPSLAIELPNGNILANDDFNHRIIVINTSTKKIVWQYGVTGKPGSSPGQLNIPDGLDIIPVSKTLVESASSVLASTTPSLFTVGQVTRHVSQFIGQQVQIQGYLLRKDNGYIIFSDEPTGTIGRYDLPVTGTGIETMQSGQKYELVGKFLGSGLSSSNGNPDHLELDNLPQIVK